jgi:hypothetical protein
LDKETGSCPFRPLHLFKVRPLYFILFFQSPMAAEENRGKAVYGAPQQQRDIVGYGASSRVSLGTL